MLRASFSKTSMKVRPMIRRFSSGSVTPSRRERKRSDSVDREHRDLQPRESLDDLPRLVRAEEPVVDQDGVDAVAQRLAEQERRDRRVHSAGERAHDRSGGRLAADRVHRIPAEGLDRPVRPDAADAEEEVFQDRGAVLGVAHFRMELQPVEFPVRVLDGGHRTRSGGPDHPEAPGRLRAPSRRGSSRRSAPVRARRRAPSPSPRVATARPYSRPFTGTTSPPPTCAIHCIP